MAGLAERLAAAALLVAMVIVFLYITVNFKPPTLKMYHTPSTPVEAGLEVVGRRSGLFLWSYRWLDLAVLSLLLLTAAVSCIALLRRGSL